MSERARQMGISDSALKRAMLLVRDLRIKAVQRGIDPRATRIALLFAEKCDREWAAQKLHPTAMVALETIAEEFYQLARGEK